MKEVYIKSFCGFFLIYFTILLFMTQYKPYFLKTNKKIHIKRRETSHLRIILYSLFYALLGSFMIYFIEKSKYLRNL